jgi:adenylate cyclase class 2
MSNAEIEVKFYLQDIGTYLQRLEEKGAQVIKPRVHEVNLRFDTVDRQLASGYRVLRLRQDAKARLTYKGPDDINAQVAIREEIEFEVSDFNKAQQFLEALGYQVVFIYEKYRTTFQLDGMEIVVDEMPFGDFTEIEGPDADQIQRLAEKLHLEWSARCKESYHQLFRIVRYNKQLLVGHLRFKDFEELTLTADDFGLTAADR